jgi:hypothetical protein
MTPAVPGGKCKPVTLTVVPRAPEVGLRVTVGAGGAVTVKNPLAGKPPTVAVIVATPKGASASMVIGMENVPAGVVVGMGVE